MASPRPDVDVADLLNVPVEPGGKVIALSDLHLPPERTDVSGRCCEVIASALAGQSAPLTVVLAVGWYLSGGRDSDFGALMRDTRTAFRYVDRGASELECRAYTYSTARHHAFNRAL